MLPSFQFLVQFNFHSFFIVFLIFDSPSESHILELFIDYVEVNSDGYLSTAQSRVQITREKSTNILRYFTVICTVGFFAL